MNTPRQRKIGEYYYAPRGYSFKIYRVTSVSPTGSSAESTGEIFEHPEDARKRVYELNGWHYTPK